MKYLMLLLVCAGCTWARQTDYCFANENNPYLQFASATSYSVANPGRRADGQIPGCHPVQFWMLARHGIRYPMPESVPKLLELTTLRNQIIDNHERRRDGRLCNDDLENLRNWSPNVNLTVEMAKRLTARGYDETKFLAKRLQSSFPDLLHPNNYNDINDQNYVFRSTNSERTRSSMEAFQEGLFNSRDMVRPVSVYGNDTLLKPYANCPRWSQGEDNDPQYAEELNKFLAGPEINDLVRNVSRRLGFQYDLSTDKIRDIYDMCRLDKAWFVERLSPWCSVFSRGELQVLEYAEDLDYYYSTGYGREVNRVIGCFPLQDMMDHFKGVEDGNVAGKPRGIFYFSTSFSVLSLLHNLGAVKDYQKLLATNYRDMMGRQWRTSAIAPFSANLVAVFYRCGDTRSPNKVMFYLQEKPLQLEGCQVGLCDWNDLKRKFSDAQCSEGACFGKGGSAVSQVMTSLISFLLIGSFLLK